MLGWYAITETSISVSLLAYLVSNVVIIVAVDDLTPWYAKYRNYVCKYTGASEHETFNHPVACKTHNP
jgi:phage-related protein